MCSTKDKKEGKTKRDLASGSSESNETKERGENEYGIVVYGRKESEDYVNLLLVVR